MFLYEAPSLSSLGGIHGHRRCMVSFVEGVVVKYLGHRSTENGRYPETPCQLRGMSLRGHVEGTNCRPQPAINRADVLPTATSCHEYL